MQYLSFAGIETDKTGTATNKKLQDRFASERKSSKVCVKL